MLSHYGQTKHENCSHDLNKYLNGIFTKEDYCFMCLEQIEEINSDI